MRKEPKASGGRGSCEDDIPGWEGAYRKKAYVEVHPHQDAGFLDDLFSKNGVKRILDLGCGDGRHLVYFARCGYGMFGLDSAPTAIELAEKWLMREGAYGELVCTDMSTIPWHSDYFDAVICINTINHHRLEAIRRTVSEIHRVLRKDGWLFVTAQTNRPKPSDLTKKGEWVELEPNTYEWLVGHEKGVPHHFFDMDELLELFKRFRIEEMHEDDRTYRCILARKIE
jgi:SAM-dependent methyltransferase